MSAGATTGPMAAMAAQYVAYLVVAPVDLLEVVEAAGVAHRIRDLACQHSSRIDPHRLNHLWPIFRQRTAVSAAAAALRTCL